MFPLLLRPRLLASQPILINLAALQAQIPPQRKGNSRRSSLALADLFGVGVGNSMKFLACFWDYKGDHERPVITQINPYPHESL